jgi:tetratricopeptide (TPR) repeat protein
MTSKRGTVEAQAYFDFGTGYAAAVRGDAATAWTIVDALGGRGNAVACTGAACAVARLKRAFVAVLQGELARRDPSAQAEALQRLEATAMEGEALPVAFGPPAIPKPLRELRAELLLDAGRASDARREFQRALAASPGRARSLLGLATAATAAGDIAIARDAVRQLRAIWHGADTTLPELAELARLEASLPQ